MDSLLFFLAIRMPLSSCILKAITEIEGYILFADLARYPTLQPYPILTRIVISFPELPIDLLRNE